MVVLVLLLSSVVGSSSTVVQLLLRPLVPTCKPTVERMEQPLGLGIGWWVAAMGRRGSVG